MRRYLPILTAAVVLTAAVAGAGSVGAADGSAEPVAARDSGSVSAAMIAATATQTAKARALRNCRKVSSKARRVDCLRRVHKRFTVVAPPQHGPIAATIDVRDKYFSPDMVSIRTGQSIVWSWNPVNADAHNVNLVSPPPGVNRLDFSTPNSPSVNFEFRRTFREPGTYGFVCSIHHLMTMTVEVSG